MNTSTALTDGQRLPPAGNRRSHLALKAPEIGGPPPHICPRCRNEAAVHARATRAIHDWATTFVECLRLRCCGRTFTVTPTGLGPRSQYSDRVVGVARALVAMGVSVRRCSAVLREAGVSVTAQTVWTWCDGMRPEMFASVEVTDTPVAPVRLELRPRLWLSVRGGNPGLAAEILSRELGRRHATVRGIAHEDSI